MNNNNNNNNIIQSNTGINIAAPWAHETTTDLHNLDGWGSPPTYIPNINEGGWGPNPSTSSHGTDPMDIDERSATSTLPTPIPAITKGNVETTYERIASLVQEDSNTHIELISKFSEATTLLAMREYANEQLMQLAGHTNRLVARFRVRPQAYFTEDQVRSIVLNIILQNTFTWIPINTYCQDCCRLMFGNYQEGHE
ncbi:hypothetical protein BDB00DRAFT_880362 [Zychaea mexicana]|uniref:uncharacterized protein n=1 Tax=Zychaea mexicana TaxID=64656 RepID=UPI0022FEF0EB|nr:uncharacterized protein BDB00DRAFT_880362 [Zychaea mexicana]KAI9468411.1 hypothetical protein BDB00DRAFT_880362 [Zychaea mexicana]